MFFESNVWIFLKCWLLIIGDWEPYLKPLKSNITRWKMNFFLSIFRTVCNAHWNWLCFIELFHPQWQLSETSLCLCALISNKISKKYSSDTLVRYGYGLKDTIASSAYVFVCIADRKAMRCFYVIWMRKQHWNWFSGTLTACTLICFKNKFSNENKFNWAFENRSKWFGVDTQWIVQI